MFPDQVLCRSLLSCGLIFPMIKSADVLHSILSHVANRFSSKNMALDVVRRCLIVTITDKCIELVHFQCIISITLFVVFCCCCCCCCCLFVCFFSYMCLLLTDEFMCRYFNPDDPEAGPAVMRKQRKIYGQGKQPIKSSVRFKT